MKKKIYGKPTPFMKAIMEAQTKAEAERSKTEVETPKENYNQFADTDS
jgi:hypothetical protein